MLTLRKLLYDARYVRWDRWELLILAHQLEGHDNEPLALTMYKVT